jgi:hypothetical protein
VWAFSGVYGPDLDQDKKKNLWEELAGIYSWWGFLGVLLAISTGVIPKRKIGIGYNFTRYVGFLGFHL